MDINAATLAQQEMALNKANIGQEILAKTLEKSAEAKQAESAETSRPTERPSSDKQGRIDLYA